MSLRQAKAKMLLSYDRRSESGSGIHRVEPHEYLNDFHAQVIKFYLNKGLTKREITETMVYKVGIDLTVE